ncbi:MAG: hypothetical protein ACXWHC_04045 [Usitatibacter sp.]
MPSTITAAKDTGTAQFRRGRDRTARVAAERIAASIAGGGNSRASS